MPEDFEGGEKGLRLVSDAFQRYLESYEEQLRSPSERNDSPTWRVQLRQQVEALETMVMDGELQELYTRGG